MTAPHRRLRIGFVALTDAAPVIMAKELGLYDERDLAVELVKQASWPALRDALLRGELEAAHCLCSMPLAVATGVGGARGGHMPIAMILAANGQAITLENGLAAAGHADLAAAGAESAARSADRPLTLAMTYRGGTHDIWLRYWLAAAGIDSLSEVRTYLARRTRSLLRASGHELSADRDDRVSSLAIVS